MLSLMIPELWHTPSTCPGTDRHQVGDNASQSPGKEGVTTGLQGCSSEVKSYKSRDNSKRLPLVIEGKNNTKTSPKPLQGERPNRH